MITIKIKNNLKRFINKINQSDINIYQIKYENNYILAKINEKDLERIKKENYYSKITIENTHGIKKIKEIIMNNKIDIILLMLFLILIFLENNIIYDVEIKHENIKIKNKVKDLLKKEDIKKYTIKKNNKKINEISDKILNNNRDFIDFISIKKIGCKYVVYIEERILTKETKDNKLCHIVSNKESIITKINTKKGISLKEKGSLVKKGDIIISGDINYNDEIKKSTCAKGKVYGTTWYKIKVNYPREKYIKVYTKREKINIKKNNNYLKKIKYKTYDEKTILKLKDYKIVKQMEYKYNKIVLTTKEIKEKAIEEAINKLKVKNKDIEINNKKVLNINTFNSKIELEVFISANEQIGEELVYEAGDTIDTR